MPAPHRIDIAEDLYDMVAAHQEAFGHPSQASALREIVTAFMDITADDRAKALAERQGRAQRWGATAQKRAARGLPRGQRLGELVAGDEDPTSGAELVNGSTPS